MFVIRRGRQNFNLAHQKKKIKNFTTKQKQQQKQTKGEKKNPKTHREKKSNSPIQTKLGKKNEKKNYSCNKQNKKKLSTKNSLVLFYSFKKNSLGLSVLYWFTKNLKVWFHSFIIHSIIYLFFSKHQTRHLPIEIMKSYKPSSSIADENELSKHLKSKILARITQNGEFNSTATTSSHLTSHREVLSDVNSRK